MRGSGSPAWVRRKRRAAGWVVSAKCMPMVRALLSPAASPTPSAGHPVTPMPPPSLASGSRTAPSALSPWFRSCTSTATIWGPKRDGERGQRYAMETPPPPTLFTSSVTVPGTACAGAVTFNPSLLRLHSPSTTWVHHVLTQPDDSEDTGALALLWL